MEALLMFLVTVAALSWVGIALSPWGPWRNREVLDVIDEPDREESHDEITVVIPARNEAEVIQHALQSVIAQGTGLKIILIDDRSDDATVAKARALESSHRRRRTASCRLERQALGPRTGPSAGHDALHAVFGCGH